MIGTIWEELEHQDTGFMDDQIDFDEIENLFSTEVKKEEGEYF